ncbi:phosphate ABC transporter substrate-binding protein, partial [Escherichia coli]|nr:phosphate ABC transporter substrate-binding protein [Escherichia coli]
MTMLKTVRFWLVELILLAVVLPVLAIIFYSCTLFFPFYAEGGILEFSATLIVTALSGLALGRVRSAFVPLNLSFISLILPETLLLFYTLVVWLTLLIITDSEFNSGLFYTGQDWLGIFSLLTEAATEDEFFTPSLMQVATPAIPAVGILVYIVSLTHAARGRNRLTNIVGWRYIVIP